MPTSRPGCRSRRARPPGMPEMPWSLHQRERVGERRVRRDGDRVHHHAGLELLRPAAPPRPAASGVEVAVDDADAAGLRHGDGEARLGDRVHRRGDDRQVEADRARQPRRRCRLRPAGRSEWPGFSRTSSKVSASRAGQQVDDAARSPCAMNQLRGAGRRRNGANPALGWRGSLTSCRAQCGTSGSDARP